MTSVMDPLRREHAELRPHVEAIRAAGDSAGDLDDVRLVAVVDRTLRFLREHLAPHADAEDAVLYPVVDRVIGASGATTTMSRDHVEVHRLVAELGVLRDAVEADGLDIGLRREVQRVLYGLYAVVSLHLAKEEEVYLPLLDAALSRAEAEEIFGRMTATGHVTASDW